MRVKIASFVNEGLGHSSSVVDLADGTALVVDPARIPTAQLSHAAPTTSPTSSPMPSVRSRCSAAGR